MSHRPCSHCGSINTGPDTLSHSKPGIFYVMLFGWLFLLIRGAFSMRVDLCRDCGALNRYKSTGSWMALLILSFIIFCIIMAVIYEPE